MILLIELWSIHRFNLFLLDKLFILTFINGKAKLNNAYKFLKKVSGTVSENRFCQLSRHNKKTKYFLLKIMSFYSTYLLVRVSYLEEGRSLATGYRDIILHHFFYFKRWFCIWQKLLSIRNVYYFLV